MSFGFLSHFSVAAASAWSISSSIFAVLINARIIAGMCGYIFSSTAASFSAPVPPPYSRSAHVTSQTFKVYENQNDKAVYIGDVTAPNYEAAKAFLILPTPKGGGFLRLTPQCH